MTTLAHIKSRCLDCDQLDDQDCWNWKDFARRGRDPMINEGGKRRYVRRVGYELARGEIPAKRQIVPTCGSVLCVNPHHMAAKTLQQVRRAAAKKGAYKMKARQMKMIRTKRAHSKLTEAAVQDIRSQAEPPSVQAKKHNITVSYAHKIRNHECWRDVDTPFAGLFAGLLVQQEAVPA